MSRIMAIDPSGNFHEGKGTTGMAIFDNNELKAVLSPSAKDYSTQEEYWDGVVLHIEMNRPDVIVLESYRLQAGKSRQQSWSQMETPQLIGVIKYFCHINKIGIVFQDPVIKPRWSDEILLEKGIIEKKGNKYLLSVTQRVTSDHVRDAIRHGLHYIKRTATK